jgi:hypothetical protein
MASKNSSEAAVDASAGNTSASNASAGNASVVDTTAVDATVVNALPHLPISYATSAPVSSPNNNIFNGAIDAVTRAPIIPMKSRNLSAPVENLN